MVVSLPEHRDGFEHLLASCQGDSSTHNTTASSIFANCEDVNSVSHASIECHLTPRAAVMNHPAMSPPLLTADLPGTGGRIRVRDADFEVEEVPSYEPCGSGDHLFLWVEKRGVAPEFFARTIAQRLGTHPGNVGTAGLKDRHAVTRQWVSVPKECEPNLAKLDGDGIKVLKTGRHTNKLKPGHLRGNRFRILIRDTNRGVDVSLILDRIRTRGMPMKSRRDRTLATVGVDVCSLLLFLGMAAPWLGCGVGKAATSLPGSERCGQCEVRAPPGGSLRRALVEYK
jgi:hypothetical protein